MEDDAIAQVVMVTNTTPEKAAQYLTLADGDPDQAVTLFFESGGRERGCGALSFGPNGSQTTTSTKAPRNGGAEKPIECYVEDIECVRKLAISRSSGNGG